jgi:DNA-directed RNA polymerase subunit beta'
MLPETINYRTLKPEKDGLFSEKIFGPTKDYECYCGKYKKIRFKGIICDRCGVEVAAARVRRERMGHIELAAPVAHTWFAKGTPNRLGLLLDLSPRSLERVLYFSQYIIIRVDEERRRQAIKGLEEETYQRLADMEAAGENGEAAPEEERQKLMTGLRTGVDEIEDLRPLTLLTESRYRDLQERYDFFEGGMGAEAALEILRDLDLESLRADLQQEIISTPSGQRRKKAAKRLRTVEAFRRSGNRPSWMVLTVLPVLPPDLRPMVQLDGGRFATSDLNDLYRRVINRNNRLKRLLDLGAPDIIVRNEKRMLQEAVDALLGSSRRPQTATAGGQKLKSLSDMLKGKQGRFRQNLLGKRVDYSGRSVIVVGPELKLHQCGLPKRMALELFKPFIMRRVIEQGMAQNIKGARRLVERGKPEVWDILEDVIKERPVLLNRAPTLHRLGIQAFEVALIDGSAIQIHPLVCAPFNADFDGDQMAVHLPLSRAAVEEARQVMLSTKNMLLPSSGEPAVAPTLDMVLGCYYLTVETPQPSGTEVKRYANFEDARLAHDMGVLDLRRTILVRDKQGQWLSTTVGRIIFNEVLPEEIGFLNQTMDKGSLKGLVTQCYHLVGDQATAELLDNLKRLGFYYATRSGVTIAMNDIEVPAGKGRLLEKAREQVDTIEREYRLGLITEDERYRQVVEVWTRTTDECTELIAQSLDRYGGVHMMATSGAKGNITQIRQMAGMRGLMTDPTGRIMDRPILSSFREGLTVLEYFISTHGARKGLADTALRTSDSGYLTRRLIDISQDVIIREEDCGTTSGVWIGQPEEQGVLPPLRERIAGRLSTGPVAHPETGEVLAESNQEIDTVAAAAIEEAGITRVHVRSPLSCESRYGMCRACYGYDLSHHQRVNMGTAVGILAAQSIGEPGTQLTMRTFHTGGVVSVDITSGLPRVEELLEARTPKGQAVVSEIDGTAEVITTAEGRRIKVTSSEVYRDEYTLPPGWKLQVAPGQKVDVGQVLAQPSQGDGDENAHPAPSLVARSSGELSVQEDRLFVYFEERDEREYPVPTASRIRVTTGDQVAAGQQFTDGHLNPNDILRIMGREAVQRYLVDQVQAVYRAQGVDINDKHIEVIARQMMTKVKIDSAGDTEFLPGELVDRFLYEDTNAKVLAEGGEPATAQPVLLGITRASLNTESWLSAASFQETTRVLTEAALWGKVDKLSGLKENVIIGKLIPARSYEPPPVEVEIDPFALIAQQRLGETTEEPTGEAPSAGEELPFEPEAAGEPEGGGAEDVASGPEAELVAAAGEVEGAEGDGEGEAEDIASGPEAELVAAAGEAEGAEGDGGGEAEDIASGPEAELVAAAGEAEGAKGDAGGEAEDTPAVGAAEEDKADPA